MIKRFLKNVFGKNIQVIGFYLAVKIDLEYLGFLFLLLGAGAGQGGHVTVETLAAAKYLGRHIKRHPRSF